MRAVLIMVLIAVAGFFILFSPWTKDTIAFFPIMTAMAALLAIASLVLNQTGWHRFRAKLEAIGDSNELQDIYNFRLVSIPVGILAAFILYAMFWVGHFISIRILPFAASQVNSIYTIRAGENPLIVAGLLFFIIGPAEEIFWRGFVQKRFSSRYGVLIGFVLATATYTLVHVWSFNLMLLAASALCGTFWGLMFALTKNLWPCIICHAVWDVTIFILLPIQ